MLCFAGSNKAPVSQDDVGLNEVIDGQTIFSREVSVAAAQCETSEQSFRWGSSFRCTNSCFYMQDITVVKVQS
jgi:hypothetical protein